MLDSSLLAEYCPKTKFRDGQEDCLKFILDSFNSNKKFVILEAPTGAGKSVIGLTLANYYNSVFYVTIQKILQSQIIKDFSSNLDIVDFKGRTNYPCTYYDKYGADKVAKKLMSEKEFEKSQVDRPTCGDGYCKRRGDSYCNTCVPTKLSEGFEDATCPYYAQMWKTMHSHVALMNFSSYLCQAGTWKFPQRDLLILDEGHQIESQVLDHVELSYSESAFKSLNYKLPELKTPEDYWLNMLENNLLESVGKLYVAAKLKGDSKEQDVYASLMQKMDIFYNAMNNGDEWVSEFINDKHGKRVRLRPVYICDYARNMLFRHASKVLIMSATILDVDVFRDSLGLGRDEIAAYRMKNRFPVKNRPIYVRSAGDITGGKKKMPTWGPKMVEKVDEILDEHKDVRGIIHTHNFDIAELLLKESKHHDRFLYQKHFNSKENMLAEHAASQNTMLLAPAMHEGLDLVNDLSRLQIICKVPWPNFIDDAQLARRVELDRRYLLWLTALKLVQSYGRSIRHDDDWADTYIVDGVFTRFVEQAGTMLPSWFRDAIIGSED